MTDWSRADLDAIGDAEEIRISTDRADHSAGPAVPIWVIRVGDELYIRSYRGPSGAWYRRARRTGAGSIRVAGRDHRITLVAAEPGTRGAVDDAFRAKYGHYGPSYLDAMTAEAVVGTTLRLDPAN